MKAALNFKKKISKIKLKNITFGLNDRKLSLASIILTMIPWNLIPFIVIYYLSKEHKDTKTLAFYYAKNFLNFGINLCFGLVFLFITDLAFLFIVLVWYLMLVFAALEAYENKKFKFPIFYEFLK